jgi:hypothetical protein
MLSEKTGAVQNVSMEELTKILNSKGLTKKSKRFKGKRLITKNDVQYMLNNSFYTGWAAFGTGEDRVFQKWENYKPLISQKLFEKVQKILKERTDKYSTRHDKHTTKPFKFRGLLKCGFCGLTMTPTDMSSNYKDKKPGEAVYYRCSYAKKNVNEEDQPKDMNWYEWKFGTNHSGVRKRGKKTFMNCPQEFWDEQEIEWIIENHLETLRFDDKKLYSKIRADIEKEWEERISFSDEYKRGLEAELAQQEKLKKGLLRQVALADEFEDDFRTELNQVKKDIENIQEKLNEIKELENDDTEQVTEMLDLCRDLHEQYHKLNDRDKSRLVNLVFKDIELLRGRISKDVEVNGKRIKKGKHNVAHLEYTEPFEQLYQLWLSKGGFPKSKTKGTSELGSGGSGGGSGKSKGCDPKLIVSKSSLINIKGTHPEASGQGSS